MKTYITYGLYIALAGLVVSLLMFVTGMHSDAAKITVAGYIAMFFHWVFGIVFIALTMKARRAAADPARGFTYGQALMAGWCTALWTALFDLVTTPLYAVVINPRMGEILMQAQSAKLEARGMNSDQIEKFQSMMHMFMNPAVAAIGAALGAILGGLIIALIAAAFFQRQAEPPQA